MNCDFNNPAMTCPRCGFDVRTVGGTEIWKKTCSGERSHPHPPAAGPGTELKKLLGKLGINATPSCGCNKHAAEMDAKGPDWCEDNIVTICGWLKEEADKQHLPFSARVAALIVWRAIGNARRKAETSKGACIDDDGQAREPTRAASG
jgi:hypothetical protein